MSYIDIAKKKGLLDNRYFYIGDGVRTLYDGHIAVDSKNSNGNIIIVNIIYDGSVS